MRKGFEGLHALVGERLGEEVRSGAFFVFTNQRRTRLKVLYFDGSGLWLMTKRLEKGTFAWPKLEEIGVPKLALRPEALAMLTDGIDLRGAKMRPWFERELYQTKLYSGLFDFGGSVDLKGEPAVTDEGADFFRLFPQRAQSLDGPLVEFGAIFGQAVGQGSAQACARLLGRVQLRAVGRQADQAHVGGHAIGPVGGMEARSIPEHDVDAGRIALGDLFEEGQAPGGVDGGPQTPKASSAPPTSSAQAV